MILRYGNYQHGLSEASIAIERETLYNAQRVAYGARERWRIAGLLQAANQAALTTALRQLQSAYAVDGQDLGIYLPDGVTPTAHQLRSAESLGGVRVVSGPFFSQGQGAEYSTFRSYQIVVEADLLFDAAALANQLMDYAETLSFAGGGPRFVYLQTLEGDPQKQLIAQNTPYQVTQSGRATGYFSHPAPNTPLWPDAEHADRRRVARLAPRRQGAAGVAYLAFTTEWEYQFEAVAPLLGVPTPR